MSNAQKAREALERMTNAVITYIDLDQGRLAYYRESTRNLKAEVARLREALEEIANISPSTHGPEEAADSAVRIAADAIAKAKGEE